jgi:hypothetical protein
VWHRVTPRCQCPIGHSLSSVPPLAGIGHSLLSTRALLRAWEEEGSGNGKGAKTGFRVRKAQKRKIWWEDLNRYRKKNSRFLMQNITNPEPIKFWFLFGSGILETLEMTFFIHANIFLSVAKLYVFWIKILSTLGDALTGCYFCLCKVYHHVLDCKIIWAACLILLC